MSDNDFDKQIKLSLEGHEDATPSSLGWERFEGKYGQSVGLSGVKGWLKGSVIMNVLLLAIVGWLWWNVDSLKERISSIENPQSNNKEQAGIDKTAPSSGNLSTTVLDSSFNEPGSASTDLQQLALAKNNQVNTSIIRHSLGKPPKPNAGYDNSDKESLYRGQARLYQKNIDDRSVFLTPSAIAFSNLPTHQQVQLDSEAMDDTENIQRRSTLPFQTVLALEKNKLGGKIAWSYGLNGNFGPAQLGEHYNGTHIGSGLSAEARFHPLFSLETGLSYQQIDVSTKTQAIMLSSWLEASGVATQYPINRLALRYQTLEVPLLIKLRLPYGDNASWFAAAGLMQSALLSKSQTFYVLEPEDDDGETGFDEEDETFTTGKLKPLYGGFQTELGYSRDIDRLPISWHLSIYYKSSLWGKIDEADKIALFGMKAGVRFSATKPK